MKRSRLILVKIFSCLLISFPISAIANEIGIFLSNQPGCKIFSSSGKSSCFKDTLISTGDIIMTKQTPSKLAIQWLVPSYVILKPAGTGQYRVTFTPPTEKKGVLSMLDDMLGFARTAGRVSHSAVTRSGMAPQHILPGDGATLLPGQLVTFSWCINGVEKIEFTNDSGNKVKEIKVAEGQHSISVNSDELGLLPMVYYRWKPSKAKKEGGRIILLGSEKAKIISEAFLVIDKELVTTAEKGIKKAALLQFLSFNYPDEYSLGWLQYKVLGDLSSQLSPGVDDFAAAEYLKIENETRLCE